MIGGMFTFSAFAAPAAPAAKPEEKMQEAPAKPDDANKPDDKAESKADAKDGTSAGAKSNEKVTGGDKH